MRPLDWITKRSQIVNPCLFFWDGNGSLTAYERQSPAHGDNRRKALSLTGSGAVRYAAASGARTNYYTNTRAAVNTSGWSGVTRVTDPDFSGGTALEITNGTINDGAFGPSAWFPIGEGGTLSFDVKWVSGEQEQWYVWGAQGGVGNTGSLINISPSDLDGGVHRLSASPANLDNFNFLALYFTRGPGAPGGTSTIRISNIALEKGTVASPTYFDGGTGAWLDPITGILGTAHASPSVSQAEAWVEEGTTQLVTNPWFAVDTAGWTGSNGTLSRVTTYAYQGPGAGNIAATGANATFTTSITAAASSHTAQVIVRNRHTAARTCQLKYNGSNIGSPVSVAADETKTITAAFTGTGGAANLEVVWTDSLNTENVVLYYAGAEAKVYATSPCPAINSAGTIQTGYAWTGPAHASSSTRTAMLVYAAHGNTRIKSVRGSLFTWFKPEADVSAVARVVVQAGAFGTLDFINTYQANSTGRFNMYTKNAAVAIDAVEVTSETAVVGSWKPAYAQWGVNRNGAKLNASELASAARAGGFGGVMGGTNIFVGGTSSTDQLNGIIGPVLIYDSPLTPAEIAKLVALGPDARFDSILRVT